MIPTCQIEDYSWDRIIEPKTFGEYSGSLLRICGNNPRKALVLLETPLGGEFPYYIAERINNLLGILSEDYLKGLGDKLVAGYFDGAILQLTIPLAEKARVKRKTGLAEREVNGYRKTPLGALLGDATAFLCLEESSSDLTTSSAYRIFGVAQSPGKRYAPLTTLMILAWLHENTKEGETVRLKDFVDEYYEFDADRFGRHSKKYGELMDSLSNNNLPRLAETGLVRYEARHPEDEMKVVPKAKGSPLLELTENGRKFYERYMERWLYALGFEEAMGRNGVRERALDNVIRPDHAEFLGMRRGKLDPVASGERMDEFSAMCRKAFLRHQQESGNMR